jgi:hypothetical protein
MSSESPDYRQPETIAWLWVAGLMAIVMLWALYELLTY